MRFGIPGVFRLVAVNVCCLVVGAVVPVAISNFPCYPCRGEYDRGSCFVALGAMICEARLGVTCVVTESWVVFGFVLRLDIAAQAILEYAIPGTVGVG